MSLKVILYDMKSVFFSRVSVLKTSRFSLLSVSFSFYTSILVRFVFDIFYYYRTFNLLHCVFGYSYYGIFNLDFIGFEEGT